MKGLDDDKDAYLIAVICAQISGLEKQRDEEQLQLQKMYDNLTETIYEDWQMGELGWRLINRKSSRTIY